MKIYKIPLWMRFIEMSHFGREKCLHIDEVGVFIKTEGKIPLTTDFIRRHLVGRKNTYCFVPANSIEEAISTFYSEWGGAKIGGEGEEAKALWINRDAPIHELSCENVKMEDNDKPVCTLFEDEVSMCFMDDWYSLKEDEDWCPMSKFWEKQDELPIKKITLDGKEFQYISMDDLS